MGEPCRWHYAHGVGRFLVPGCWNRAVNGDNADCHCEGGDPDCDCGGAAAIAAAEKRGRIAGLREAETLLEEHGRLDALYPCEDELMERVISAIRRAADKLEQSP